MTTYHLEIHGARRCTRDASDSLLLALAGVPYRTDEFLEEAVDALKEAFAHLGYEITIRKGLKEDAE